MAKRTRTAGLEARLTAEAERLEAELRRRRAAMAALGPEPEDERIVTMRLVRDSLARALPPKPPAR